jgi:hypothetical protein
MTLRALKELIFKIPSLLGFLWRKIVLKRPSKEITLDSVNNFLTAVENKAASDPWMEEQVQLRIGLVFENSPLCIEAGRCVQCGCDIPDKFYEPKGCDHGCYGPLPERPADQTNHEQDNQERR